MKPKPAAGEANCLYDASGNYIGPGVLPTVDGSLAALTPAMLTDGPFCGGGSNQFDPDLLRVRKVRVTLRIQVASAALRGTDQTLWANPGRSSRRGALGARLHRELRGHASKPEPGSLRMLLWT